MSNDAKALMLGTIVVILALIGVVYTLALPNTGLVESVVLMEGTAVETTLPAWVGYVGHAAWMTIATAVVGLVLLYPLTYMGRGLIRVLAAVVKCVSA